MRSAVAETDFETSGYSADGDNFVAANGDRVGVGILRVGSENLAVKENPVVRSFLGVESSDER